VKKLLLIFFLLIGSLSYGQTTFTQTFVDRCTGEVKVVTANFVNGSATVSFYDRIRTFTYQEYTSGVLHAWLMETYAWWTALSPCSTTTQQTQQAQQQAQQAQQQAQQAQTAASNATQSASSATQAATSATSINTTAPTTTAPTTTAPTTTAPTTSSTPPPAETTTSAPTTEAPVTNTGSTETQTGGTTNETSTNNTTSNESSSANTSTEGNSGGTETNSTESSSSETSTENTSTDSSSESTSESSTESSGTEESGGDVESSESTETESTETESTETESTEESSTEETSSEESSEETSSEESSEESTEESSEESSEESTEEESSEESSEEESSEEESSEESEEESSEEESSEEESEESDEESEESEEESEEEESEEESEETEEEEDSEEEEEEKQFMPIQLKADLMSMQTPLGPYNQVLNIGASRSSIYGDVAYTANVMVWDNLQQVSFMGARSKVTLTEDFKVKNISATSIGYSNNFGYSTMMLSKSLMKPFENGLTLGLGISAGTSFVSYPIKENFMISYNVLATKSFKISPAITYSPALIWTQTPFISGESGVSFDWEQPLGFKFENQLRGTEIDGMVILANSFTIQLTPRFSFNIGWTGIKSTNPTIPLINSFMIGSKIPL